MAAESLPPILLEAWGGLSHIKRKTRVEWSSACPMCGGQDRFVMREDGPDSRGWCRRCNYFAFARNVGGKEIDPEAAARWEREAEQRREIAEQRRQERLKQLRESNDYLRWHENLPDYGIEAWRNEGIPSAAIPIFKLGWNPERPYTDPMDGLVKFSPALTIPYLDWNHNLKTIQFKLMRVGFPDKYRFYGGLSASMFYCPREAEGKTLVVEGAKKAIVTYLHIGASYNIVALPSKRPSYELLAELRESSDELFVLLDPDAHCDNERNPETSAQRMARLLGTGRAKFVSLWEKVDDWLLGKSSSTEAAASLTRIIEGGTRTLVPSGASNTW